MRLVRLVRVTLHNQVGCHGWFTVTTVAVLYILDGTEKQTADYGSMHSIPRQALQISICHQIRRELVQEIQAMHMCPAGRWNAHRSQQVLAQYPIPRNTYQSIK